MTTTMGPGAHDGHSGRADDAGVRPPSRRLLRIQEAAEVLGIGRSTAYELITTGALRGLKVGRSLRVATEDIEAYIDRLRAEAE
jgi:excisionase family DNA binding protein